MWSFATEPDFQAKLDWVSGMMADYVQPLDLVYPDQAQRPPDEVRPLLARLQADVRDHELWACHLPPELGGRGFGAVKLALLNEILGRSMGSEGLGWGPTIFGTQAPDTGNAEIIAHYGTPEQKERYLRPLLDGTMYSCFSMTEPQGGADPQVFTTRAVRDGDDWILDGEKWFSSNARFSQLLVVMAITNPDVPVHKGSSIFLVPADTPGVTVLRDVGTGADPVGQGIHAYLSYDGVRVPGDALLGPEGQGFRIAQTRLGGGRLHHAMRALGQCRYALDMLCERSLSRFTKGSVLADKQSVQADIAESYLELEQFRLLVLQTAWRVDERGADACRKEIAGCKVVAAKVLPSIIGRSVHLHGSLGMSNELPLARMWMQAPWMGVMDGPTEVHLTTIAKHVLGAYRPAPTGWPTQHLPTLVADARTRVRELIRER